MKMKKSVIAIFAAALMLMAAASFAQTPLLPGLRSPRPG